MKRLDENEINTVAGATSIYAPAATHSADGPSFPYIPPPWIWLK